MFLTKYAKLFSYVIDLLATFAYCNALSLTKEESKLTCLNIHDYVFISLYMEKIIISQNTCERKKEVLATQKEHPNCGLNSQVSLTLPKEGNLSKRRQMLLIV